MAKNDTINAAAAPAQADALKSQPMEQPATGGSYMRHPDTGELRANDADAAKSSGKKEHAE